MPLQKLKFLLGLLAAALALIGCTPTPETVGDMAKTSIQNVLRVDPRFKDTGVEVVSVQLTATGERQYQGIANIKYKDGVHEVPVKVLLDGLSIKWDTAPEAFSFIPPNRPPL